MAVLPAPCAMLIASLNLVSATARTSCFVISGPGSPSTVGIVISQKASPRAIRGKLPQVRATGFQIRQAVNAGERLAVEARQHILALEARGLERRVGGVSAPTA